jgi:hypothetical protein
MPKRWILKFWNVGPEFMGWQIVTMNFSYSFMDQQIRKKKALPFKDWGYKWDENTHTGEIVHGITTVGHYSATEIEEDG